LQGLATSTACRAAAPVQGSGICASVFIQKTIAARMYIIFLILNYF
jgi:hypothetical protein